MRRTRLFRTASFRLAALYLALFAASTVMLGAFVYGAVRHEILTGFDEGLIEERDALQRVFADGGRNRLAGVLDARAASGGQLSAGLWGPDGRRLGGDLTLPPSALPRESGWFETPETEEGEAPEPQPETLRALAARLSDGSLLVVAEERQRTDEVLRTHHDGFRMGLSGNRRARRRGRPLAQRAIPSPHRCDAPHGAGDHGRRLEPANSALVGQ